MYSRNVAFVSAEDHNSDVNGCQRSNRLQEVQKPTYSAGSEIEWECLLIELVVTNLATTGVCQRIAPMPCRLMSWRLGGSEGR